MSTGPQQEYIHTAYSCNSVRTVRLGWCHVGAPYSTRQIQYVQEARKHPHTLQFIDRTAQSQLHAICTGMQHVHTYVRTVHTAHTAHTVHILVTFTRCRVKWTHLSHHLHDDALEHRAPEEQAHNLDYVLLPQMAALDGEAHLNTHLLHAQHRHTAVERHSLHT